MAYGVLTAVKGQTTFQSDLLLHDQSPGVTDHTTSRYALQPDSAHVPGSLPVRDSNVADWG